MLRVLCTLLGVCLLSINSSAQVEGGTWSLQEAISYALDHNISIKQNVLNQRLSKLTLRQSQLSQLPNVNANSTLGRSYGRSVDPTSNQFVDGSSYDFLSLSGNVDVLVFGWFQRRNTIAQNKFSLRAASADLEQLKNDVSLNVATGYLRALLAKEQVAINEKQVSLSLAQLKQTRQFAEAGRLPELNVAQLESQLATDSSSLITAITNYNAAILDIKAILNLDFEEPFDVYVPDVAIGEVINIAGLSPEDIYIEALQHFGSIEGSEYRLKAAKKGFAASKSALLPKLSLGAQLGSNWSSNLKEFTGFTPTGTRATGDFVPIRVQAFNLDTLLPVFQQVGTFATRDVPLQQQLDNNFRQTITLNLNIPLFNGWQAQTAAKQARINVQTQELNKYQAELKLKQDVYKAYNDAKNALQKYNAANRAMVAATRAYDFAEKRYELGLTNTIEYLTTQNNQFSAAANFASAKYDLIFKLKVIDYYLGKEIKL